MLLEFKSLWVGTLRPIYMLVEDAYDKIQCRSIEVLSDHHVPFLKKQS